MMENIAHCNRDQPEQAAAFYTVKETAQHLRLCEKQIRRLSGFSLTIRAAGQSIWP